MSLDSLLNIEITHESEGFVPWHNAGATIVAVTIKMLEDLAANAVSHPMSTTFEGWNAKLEYHAKQLRSWLEEDNDHSAQMGQASMAWVAVNIDHLWS